MKSCQDKQGPMTMKCLGKNYNSFFFFFLATQLGFQF